jgi:SAM-dependent methyltransferase
MKKILAFIKSLLPISLIKFKRYIVRMWWLIDSVKAKNKRKCPICNYYGFFAFCGSPPRPDGYCPSCGSRERHRLFWLWLSSNMDLLRGPILHFAPESVLEGKFREMHVDYRTADLYNKADMKLNIEKIALDDCSLSTIICHQVLEHVDDMKAIPELYRVLKPQGTLMVSVPIIDGWSKTYENPAVKTPEMRELHYGQTDHLRYYGRDFSDRLMKCGFKQIQEVTAEGEDVITYSLLRGEKIFICIK